MIRADSTLEMMIHTDAEDIWLASAEPQVRLKDEQASPANSFYERYLGGTLSGRPIAARCRQATSNRLATEPRTDGGRPTGATSARMAPPRRPTRPRGKQPLCRAPTTARPRATCAIPADSGTLDASGDEDKPHRVRATPSSVSTRPRTPLTCSRWKPSLRATRNDHKRPFGRRLDSASSGLWPAALLVLRRGSPCPGVRPDPRAQVP